MSNPATQSKWFHPCPKCGAQSSFKLRPDTQHWGEVRCPEHGHSWIKKPDDEKKRTLKRNQSLVKDFPSLIRHGINAEANTYCWWCMRTDSTLRSLRPVLVLNAHHIVEVDQGGDDSQDNLMILCDECHRECHRRREAFARYTDAERVE